MRKHEDPRSSGNFIIIIIFIIIWPSNLTHSIVRCLQGIHSASEQCAKVWVPAQHVVMATSTWLWLHLDRVWKSDNVWWSLAINLLGLSSHLKLDASSSLLGENRVCDPLLNLEFRTPPPPTPRHSLTIPALKVCHTFSLSDSDTADGFTLQVH